MEQIEIKENVFKTRKEVEDFFGSTMFKFEYISDSIASFKTLNPIEIKDVLTNFEVCFYYESIETIFCYSSFKDWFDDLKIYEVIAEQPEFNTRTTLYFEKYK